MSSSGKKSRRSSKSFSRALLDVAPPSPNSVPPLTLDTSAERENALDISTLLGELFSLPGVSFHLAKTIGKDEYEISCARPDDGIDACATVSAGTNTLVLNGIRILKMSSLAAFKRSLPAAIGAYQHRRRFPEMACELTRLARSHELHVETKILDEKEAWALAVDLEDRPIIVFYFPTRGGAPSLTEGDFPPSAADFVSSAKKEVARFFESDEPAPAERTMRRRFSCVAPLAASNKYSRSADRIPLSARTRTSSLLGGARSPSKNNIQPLPVTPEETPWDGGSSLDDIVERLAKLEADGADATLLRDRVTDLEDRLDRQERRVASLELELQQKDLLLGEFRQQSSALLTVQAEMRELRRLSDSTTTLTSLVERHDKSIEGFARWAERLDDVARAFGGHSPRGAK